MKTIRFTQKVEVIESYNIEYTQEEFELDCVHFEIKDFSYEELCEVLLHKKDDIMIKVTEYHVDDYTGEFGYSPHFVSAYEFFSRLLCDYSFDAGPWDTDTISIYNREIFVEE